MTDQTEPLLGGSASVELASNRTSLAFERTRMGADRTLMAIVRTSLSLISFGFTISEAFHRLGESGVTPGSDHGPRTLGLALILLGVLLLIMGLGSHMNFGRALTARRDRLFQSHLLHSQIEYRATPTFVIAFLLLAVGVVAAASIIRRMV